MPSRLFQNMFFGWLKVVFRQIRKGNSTGFNAIALTLFIMFFFPIGVR